MRAATYAVGLAESRRVPQLRGEVALALHPLFVELDVAALAFHPRQSEAPRVRAIFLYHLQRIDGVAIGFGPHLALGFAPPAVDLHRSARLFVHAATARHHTPCAPTE